MKMAHGEWIPPLGGRILQLVRGCGLISWYSLGAFLQLELLPLLDRFLDRLGQRPSHGQVDLAGQLLARLSVAGVVDAGPFTVLGDPPGDREHPRDQLRVVADHLAQQVRDQEVLGRVAARIRRMPGYLDQRRDPRFDLSSGAPARTSS